VNLPDAAAERRALCPRCTRPRASCLCDLVVPVAPHVATLVLQHPQEQRQAKNSVGLLRLSLSDCSVWVGEQFDADELTRRLHPPGRLSLLLYPATPGHNAPPCPAPLPPPEQLQLVVLDGTWRKSLKLLMAHPLLQALPRWSLGNAPACSPYSALRKARQPHQLSTLEAVCHALASLEQAPQRYAPLLAGFEGLVAQQLRRTRAGAAGGHPASGGLQAAD
jgi:DTW domain-containing protein YfiP